MKVIGLFCVLCLLLVSVRAQNVKVTIDDESGSAVIAALSKKTISDAEIERIAQLDGNRAD